VQHRVAKEGVDGGEAGVTAACAVMALLFQMIQKITEEGRIQIIDRKLGRQFF
jgi:hypothetical protein